MKWSIGWGPIPYCNMNCEFCYSKYVRSDFGKTRNLDEWKGFVDRNHKTIASINYGTGENTMADDWFKLIAYIRERYPEIRQALTTNGYLSHQVKMHKEYDEIVKMAIDEVDISLDFADADRHNKFRGQPNAYKWAIDSLEYCQINNKPCTIVFLGTDEVLDINNISRLFDIAELYNTILRTNIYRPTKGIDDISKRYIASFDKVLQLLFWVYENHHILAISDPLFSALLLEDVREIDHSGIDSVRILHDGAVTPSTYLISDEFKAGSIAVDGLQKLAFPQNKIPDDCHDCPYVANCQGGVVDRRYLWFHSLNERDPYCPFRSGNTIPSRKIKLSSTKSFQSVHYGYLPTMFFAP